MQQYLNLVQHVLKNGTLTTNRTATPTLSVFGGQLVFDLQAGFPLLTTKQVHFHSILVELLWFIKGGTNIRYLVENNVRIWNEWPYQKYCSGFANPPLSLKEFVNQIRTDAVFANKHGNLGPVYGHQWRNANGIDQLKNAIDLIQTNQHSRRIIVCSWNPQDLEQMALPPCHCLFQFYVNDNKLSCHLYQRSADLFLGVPFNIASYALLTYMVAHVCNLEVGQFFHSFGDLHIYTNHIEQCQIQLQRIPYKLSQLKIKRQVCNVNDFKIEDFEIVNYVHHPKLVGKVAV